MGWLRMLWDGRTNYTMTSEYKWLLGAKACPWWSRTIWARTISPRHATMFWFLMQQRIPIKSRLARFLEQGPKLNVL